MGKRWSELSQGQRRAILAAAAVDGVLKIAALLDMRKRPASEVRGPKWLWASSVAVVGSAGILPMSYFLFGRRKEV
jgi:hypothetical protein